MKQLDSRLWSPLHTAAASGSLEAAKELIKCGADVGLITCENAAAVHLCNNERLRVFMMWSIVLKEAGAAAVVDAINLVRKCAHPPVPEKIHQAKSRYADKVTVKKVEWEVCSSVDSKSFPQDMHPLHVAVVCGSTHVVDVIIRSLSNVIPHTRLKFMSLQPFSSFGAFRSTFRPGCSVFCRRMRRRRRGQAKRWICCWR